MKSLAYWIQQADFSASDHEVAAVEDAVSALGTMTGTELRLQAELETAGKQYCPPGIGFIDPKGPILHVCPTIGGASHGALSSHAGAKTPWLHPDF